MGPTAQDFYAALGLGEKETTISATDVNGVSLAVIQGHSQISYEQQSALETLQAEIEALRRQHAGLAARLAALEGNAE